MVKTLNAIVAGALLLGGHLLTLNVHGQGALRITSLGPTSGSPGTPVTVRGENLIGVTSVTFNGVAANFTEFSSTRLSTTVPVGATTGPVIVTTVADEATSPEVFTVFNPNAPGITSISPKEGKPGTPVQIDGTNLVTATSVKFNGVNAAFTVNAGILFGTVPANSTSGRIAVITPDGTAESADLFTVLTSVTAPTITSFKPTTGDPGVTKVQISGTNLDKVNFVTFNGVPVSASQVDYSFAAFGLLIVTVPADATTGPIAVISPFGSTTSTTIFTVALRPPPVITGFTPTSGPAGSSVTIQGSNLQNVTAVTFAGVNATTFSAFGASVLATVPAGAVNGPLTIVTPSGTFTTTGTFTVSVANQPTIASVTPETGEPGAQIQIQGVNLDGATSVLFNGTEAPFNVLAGAIFATVPNNATTGPVTVTTPTGAATTPGVFTVLTPNTQPTLSSFTPANGPVGTVVEIRGANLTGITAVRFNGVEATFTNLFSGLISAMVPASATTGPISVHTLTTTTVTVAPFQITTVIPPAIPVIDSFSPTSGIAGTSVQIQGSNFSDLIDVRFNGIAAAFTASSESQLVATVPIGAVAGPITITSAKGTGASQNHFEIPLLSPPSITNFGPTEGVAGVSISINGADLKNVLKVTFGGLEAQFTNPTEKLVVAVVPPGAVTGPIKVSTAGGIADSPSFFRVLQPPVITGMTPATGLVGASIGIHGANFVQVQAVKFNGTEAKFTISSETLIIGEVPVGATTGPVTIITVAGPAVSPGSFAVMQLPKITSLTPATGGAGTSVEIHGANFENVQNVKFNSIEARFSTVSPTLIRAEAPAGAGLGLVTVTTAAGAATSPVTFELLPPPAVTGLAPASGPVGASVEIHGANFVNVQAVKFNSVEAKFTVITPILITAEVPAGAGTGLVTVTTADGTATGPIPFETLRPPAIASFAPTRGDAGTPVEIKGADFLNVQAVKFNGTEAKFTLVSPTLIIAVVPATATSGLVNVIAPLGTANSSSSFEVTNPPVPVSPTLTVRGTVAGQVEISWPDTATGFLLQESSDLGAAAGWSNVTAPPNHADGIYRASLTLGSGVRFYRLIHP